MQIVYAMVSAERFHYNKGGPMGQKPVELPVAHDDEVVSAHVPWLLELTRTGRARSVMAHVRILVPQVSEQWKMLTNGDIGDEERRRIVDAFEQRTGRRQGEVTEIGLPDAFPAFGQIALGGYLTFGTEMPGWADMAKRYRRLPDTVHVLQELNGRADAAKRLLDIVQMFGLPHAGVNTEFASEALKRVNDRLYGGRDKRRTGLRSLALCLFSSIVCRMIAPEIGWNSPNGGNREVLESWEKAIAAMVLATEEEMKMDYELPETTLREINICVRDLMLAVFERARPFVLMPP